MPYVDGFVMAIPANKKQEFVEFCKIMKTIATEKGALSTVDCWGDDVPKGKITSMLKAVQAKEDEVVVFSWIIWPDKQTRDAALKSMMEDPRINDIEMPFDGKRVIYGGFQQLEY